jgi:hypothetical protein
LKGAFFSDVASPARKEMQSGQPAGMAPRRYMDDVNPIAAIQL